MIVEQEAEQVTNEDLEEEEEPNCSRRPVHGRQEDNS